jgi:hypothetical protein
MKYYHTFLVNFETTFCLFLSCLILFEMEGKCRHPYFFVKPLNINREQLSFDLEFSLSLLRPGTPPGAPSYCLATQLLLLASQRQTGPRNEKLTFYVSIPNVRLNNIFFCRLTYLTVPGMVKCIELRVGCEAVAHLARKTRTKLNSIVFIKSFSYTVICFILPM